MFRVGVSQASALLELVVLGVVFSGLRVVGRGNGGGGGQARERDGPSARVPWQDDLDCLEARRQRIEEPMQLQLENQTHLV